MQTRLKKNFDKKDFLTGASVFRQASWYLVSLLFFRSGVIPFSNLMICILRVFGAKVGKNVRIKPHVYIKYPWKLIIGDNSWIANCYIENLDWVIIGPHVCISQQVMILTGNHNYKSTSFDLMTSPVTLESGVWLCSNSIITPGLTAGTHSVLTAGSVAQTDLQPYKVYQGNPAKMVRIRNFVA